MVINGVKLADIGYYINLDKSVDRNENIKKQILEFNIENLHRFSALTDDLIQSSATKSHKKIFELCKEQNIETVLILEDDFQLYQNVYVGDNTCSKPLVEYLGEIIQEINNLDWDVIMFGFNGRKPAIPISNHFSIVFKSTGAWGYIIKKRAYEYVLNNYNYYNDRLAIDDILPLLNFYNFTTLATNVQIVHHAVGFISTLNPKGPVDYRVWIDGNYYNSIWKHTNFIDDFDKNLNNIFLNSKICRDNVFIFKNYPKEINLIEDFIKSDTKYQSSLILLDKNEISNNEMTKINYHFMVESPFLVYWEDQINNIKKYYKNICYVDVSNNTSHYE
jgi:GR25 family glycosyltransferase involved in LPS biosynthesis